jgi:retron-type reverse transcriptase
VQEVHRLLMQGYREVVDADLSGYFDSIPHAELMLCVARRVSDKALLHLVGGKGDRHHLCEAPFGPFRQMVHVTFSPCLADRARNSAAK